MARPYVTIDLAKVERNTRAIVELCAAHGIAVMGVTKGTSGHPEVAKAMLRGGVSSIGESRIENIARLKAAAVSASYALIRIPRLSGVEDVLDAATLSLHSELSVLAELSNAAERRDVRHDVIVMVDLGDLREGVWPDELIPFVREMLQLRGIRLAGLGASLTCFSGVVPSEDNMLHLVDSADRVERTFDLSLPRISGGSSSALELISTGRMPKRINQVRIGEAILLGRETVHRRPWPGTVQDAFLLHAEILELKEKPSVPIGQRSEDAFGHLPAVEERGSMLRALLNVGRQDVDAGGLTPLVPGLRVLGASSDYLVVDVTAAGGRIRIGDEVAFSLNYAALLATMTSPYVEKRTIA